MSRIVKALLVTLVVGALIFGAAFGFANTLDITGVDKLGSRTVAVDSPEAVIDVGWEVSPDGTDVTGVTVTFGTKVSGTVYVTLYDATPAPIGWSPKTPTTITDASSVVVPINTAITDPAAVTKTLITFVQTAP